MAHIGGRLRVLLGILGLLSFLTYLALPPSSMSAPAPSPSIPLSALLERAAAGIIARAAAYDASSTRHLGIDLSGLSMASYVSALTRVHARLFPGPDALGIWDAALARLELVPPRTRPLPRVVFTTDRGGPQDAPSQFQSWAKENPEFEVRFIDDAAMDAWFNATFDADVARELRGWSGVARADMFRYLVLLVHGGVYTDTDTACVRPIRDWATSPASPALPPLLAALPELAHLADPSSFPSPDAAAAADADAGPGLLVALEADAPRSGADWRAQHFTRGLQVVQWTLLAKPGHPVLLDVVGHALAAAHARAKRDTDEAILDWTGPGAFTDALLRFLLFRHGVHPLELSGLTQPVRYGDVVIMPEHSFRADASEGFQGDHRVVWHGFFGRWKEQ
ncbi:hypothetical protein Q5752_002335 [Cryptotrichosporon argae]